MPRRRPAVPILAVAAFTSGCALLDWTDDLDEPGVDLHVPEAAPELDAARPAEPRRTAEEIARYILPRDTIGPGVEVIGRLPPRTDCPRMPNAWRPDPARRGRRPFDLDSIRKLPEAVADSLAAVGALPRLDTVVYDARVIDLDSLSKLPDSTRQRLIQADSLPTLEPAPRRAGAAPMPVVPLDSAGSRMPVHPIPECRPAGGR